MVDYLLYTIFFMHYVQSEKLWLEQCLQWLTSPQTLKTPTTPLKCFTNCSLNTVQTCHLDIKYTCTYVFSSHALIIQFNNAQDSNILKIEIYFFGSNIWLLDTKKWQLSPMVSLFLLAATLVSTITHELCLFCRKNHP